MGLDEVDRDDTIAGLRRHRRARRATNRGVLTWLRREARRGMAIGGLCTGALGAGARPGCSTARRRTIHWENQDSFEEEFDDVKLTKSVFVIDGNRYTDRRRHLLDRPDAEAHRRTTTGDEIANPVADQLIYTAIRTDQDKQRLSIPTRIGVRHPKLSPGDPDDGDQHRGSDLARADLAQDVGMSTRQLERLFRRYLNRSPKRYYMELRLQKARNLLMQTDMSVINVALACGFASPSHFSKCYRAHYKTTPYRERGTQGAGVPGVSRLSI